MEDDRKKNKQNRIVSFDEAVRGNKPEEEDDQEYARQVKRHRLLNRLGIGFLFAVVIGIMAYLLIVRRTESYSSVGFEWEQSVLTSANQRYINFNGGILKYGPEGANFYTSGEKEKWAASYTMADPKAVCRDGYALIFDQGARKAAILSAETGLTGLIETEEIITKGTVSSQGVSALIQEENLSNTIYFYDNSGRVLDIAIHTLVNQSGYPVDIDFSPDGQMMMASFVYVDSGVSQNQIVFYNFDEKRSTTGVVGAFRKYGDTLFADVAFLNNDRAVALGDGCAVYYNLKNKTAPEEMAVFEYEEEITQVAYGDKGLVVATRNGELAKSHRLHYINVDGHEMFNQESTFDIKTMNLTENGVYLVSDAAVCYINLSGKTFFSGSLECPIIKLNNPGEENELLVVTDNRIVFLKLFRG